jgi:hypothetical protein
VTPTTAAPPALSTRGAFRQVDEVGYLLEFAALGLRYEVSRLRRERHELHGELSVVCDFVGARTVDGMLSVGTFNLSSPPARATRAKDLAAKSNAPEVDFGHHLEELCQRVLSAEKAGTPAVLLRNVEPRDEDAEFVRIHGIPVPLRHPMIMFGDGGTGKTTLALSIACELERAGISVLYCDWELDAYEHRRLLGRLYPAHDLPDVKYRRCERPLAVEVDGILQQVRQCGVDYVVCDSVAFACEGPPESAEVAQGYFRALRQLRVGSLNICHTNKSETADQRPFGSAFWHNGARATWYLQREDGSVEDQIVLGAFNRKNNLGRLEPAIGLAVDFSDGRTTIQATNIQDTEQLAAKLPLTQRMRAALRRGPRTLASLSEELGASVDTLERYLRPRNGRPSMFTRIVSRDDGMHRIALVERRPA